jgi:hypothetical protein
MLLVKRPGCRLRDNMVECPHDLMLNKASAERVDVRATSSASCATGITDTVTRRRAGRARHSTAADRIAPCLPRGQHSTAAPFATHARDERTT